MTPDEFRAIQQGLGLSDTEMGQALGYSGNAARQVRRLKADEDHSTHRRIMPAIERLMLMFEWFGVPEEFLAN